MKSVAKGMVVGKMTGGGDLVVGGGDGGVMPAPKVAQNWKEKEAAQGRYTDDGSMMSGGRSTPDIVGYGRPAPPAYATGPGETIEGQKAYPSDAKR